MTPTPISAKQIVNNENIIHFPNVENINRNISLSELIYEHLKNNGNKIAQIDSVTGRKETFNEILSKSVNLAQALKAKGLTTNDVISLCCYNNMDYILLIVSCVFLGIRFCAIDVSASQTEIIHCIKLVKPKLLFCENVNEKNIKSAIKNAEIDSEIVVFDKSEEFTTLEEFVNKFQTNEVFQLNTNTNLKDTACICFTSGTSGLSKAAQISCYGLYYSSKEIIKSLSGVERYLIFTLPYWISNLTFIIGGIIEGLTRINYKMFDENTIAKVVQDYKANVSLFTQQVINIINKNLDCCKYDTSSLKYIYYGGSYIGINQIIKLQKSFPKTLISNGYGMTEAAGVIFIPHDTESVIDSKNYVSVGRPRNGIYYKIVDLESDEILGPNKSGELRIKYEGIMNGYLNQEDVTANAFDTDGYFKTGDVAYYDQNYNFFIVDRIKEIFKFRAYHVSPSVIENKLFALPEIKDVAVIPIYHEKDGEIPMAVVVLHENATITDKQIIQYIKDNLSDIYQLRGGVKFVHSLPRTGTGKLRKKYLKDLIVSEN